MAEESTIACAAPDEQEKPQEPKVMNLSEAHGVAKVDKEADSRRTLFLEGFHDGIPIALGYFVVSFTLGIAAKAAGLTPFQGFVASFFNNASAGEYAAFTLIAAKASYLELAIMTLVANARYMLMSCVVSQKFAPGTPLYHRLLVGFDITDEIFGITIARPGKLAPFAVPRGLPRRHPHRARLFRRVVHARHRGEGGWPHAVPRLRGEFL